MRREKIQSSYYTSPEDAERFLKFIDDVWGLDGVTAFEPCVGSGALVRAGEAYDMKWVTNELFPETTNFTPDFSEDIFELSPSRINLGENSMVITNPPFTGKRNGVALSSCVAARGARFSSRIAMILPAYALRSRHHHQVNQLHIVAYTPPSDSAYDVGDSHGGTSKVRTTMVLYEYRPDKEGATDWDRSPVEGLEWLDSYDGATHAVQHWGGVTCRALDGSYGRDYPYANETPAHITDPRIEAILLSKELSEYLSDKSADVVMAPHYELNHLVRHALKGMKGE